MSELYKYLLEGVLIIGDRKLVASLEKEQIILDLKRLLEQDTQAKKYIIENFKVKILSRNMASGEIKKWVKDEGFSLWEIIDITEEPEEPPQKVIVPKPLPPRRRYEDDEDD